MSQYLQSNAPFKAIQLKFKLRRGVSSIGEDLNCQQHDLDNCKTCGEYECIKHLIFYCKQHMDLRRNLFNAIKLSYGDNIFNLFLESPDFTLTCLLGDEDDDFNKQFLQYVSKAWSVQQNL